MRCPSCGSLLESGAEQCLECGAPFANNELASAEKKLPPNGTSLSGNDDSGIFETANVQQPPTSRLIEFPGVSRNSLPQWRKELSERVREVQEKRAREAALENAEQERLSKNKSPGSSQLELLPQADVPSVNPLVTAALRRIERAHQQVAPSDAHSNQTPVVATAACAAENQFDDEPRRRIGVVGIVAAVNLKESNEGVLAVDPRPADTVNNLVVVPSRTSSTEDFAGKAKPRRMISDDPNDPALNYLDSVPTTFRVEAGRYNHAPAAIRFIAALVDLLVVALFCTPFAAVVGLLEGSWQDWLVIAMGVTVFSVMSFLYLTISTAMTGRTLGTRLFSLRIVDSRTGLIPTGKQSAGRALVYLVTLLTLGLAALYALMDSDKRTAHDRLTRTAVIAV